MSDVTSIVFEKAKRLLDNTAHYRGLLAGEPCPTLPNEPMRIGPHFEVMFERKDLWRSFQESGWKSMIIVGQANNNVDVFGVLSALDAFVDGKKGKVFYFSDLKVNGQGSRQVVGAFRKVFRGLVSIVEEHALCYTVVLDDNEAGVLALVRGRGGIHYLPHYRYEAHTLLLGPTFLKKQTPPGYRLQPTTPTSDRAVESFLESQAQNVSVSLNVGDILSRKHEYRNCTDFVVRNGADEIVAHIAVVEPRTRELHIKPKTLLARSLALSAASGRRAERYHIGLTYLLYSGTDLFFETHKDWLLDALRAQGALKLLQVVTYLNTRSADTQRFRLSTKNLDVRTPGTFYRVSASEDCVAQTKPCVLNPLAL